MYANVPGSGSAVHAPSGTGELGPDAGPAPWAYLVWSPRPQALIAAHRAFVNTLATAYAKQCRASLETSGHPDYPQAREAAETARQEYLDAQGRFDDFIAHSASGVIPLQNAD